MDALPKPWGKIGRHGVWEKLQIGDVSDGEQKTWPLGDRKYWRGSDEHYLITLAEAWEKDRQPGVNYYLERLPDGYAVFMTEQHGGGQQYKRLFGHPKGKFYDSTLKFQPHFLWLMSGMKGECSCVLCGNKKPALATRPKLQLRAHADPVRPSRPRIPTDALKEEDNESATGIASRRARRDVKVASGAFAVDEEGTEDVFKAFIKRLHAARDSKRGIDLDIEELNSLDWRAEHLQEDGFNLMAVRVKQLEHQPSFFPRVGEVVLWCTNLLNRQQLVFDEKTSTYVLYSRRSRKVVGAPLWRAGVVTSAPSAWDQQNGAVDYQDINNSLEKRTALNIAGFRVETLPNPNQPNDKSASKQYKWAALRCIRPLSHWRLVTQGCPLTQLHPSIRNALTCSTSISLLEKFKATGSWPNCVIHCKGVYLGPELIMVGDTVRLKSQITADGASFGCEEVLRVESIRLNLEGLQDIHAEAKSPALASASWVSFVGQAFTTDSSQAYRVIDRLNGSSLPVVVPVTEIQTILKAFGTEECGSWFYMHSKSKRFLVSHEQVLGRLHEPAAVRLWNHRRFETQAGRRLKAQQPLLHYDIPGITMARMIATRTDTRLPDPEAKEIVWYWADTRAEALAVESFNGHEVGKYWHVRDKETLESWQVQMRIINGITVPSSEPSIYVPLSAIPERRRGRKAGTRVVNGKVVYPGDPEYEAAASAPNKPKPSSQMAGAALASTDEGESGNSDEDLESNDPKLDLDNWTKAEGQDNVPLYQSNIQNSRGSSASRPEAPSPPVKAPKQILTKTQIMVAAGEGNEEIVEDDGFEDDWYDAPLPLARGGTDESSGGDYSPAPERGGPESPR
jgi:hypothetical protein